MADIFKDIADLSEEQRELLERMMREEGIARSVIIPQRRDRESFPLSYAQQRLWFLDQLEPNTALYNVFYPARLRGNLNIAALERTLNEIIRRHEILRTVFALDDAQPVQIVLPGLELNLKVIDLTSPDETRRELEAARIANEAARQPFDLKQGPLIRAKLLQLAERDHVLLVTMHHIITDGWSFNIFAREMVAIYEAFSRGDPSPLPDLSIQYADFAHWQRQWLKGDYIQEQLAYWKQHLSGKLAMLELPTDRPRPAVRTYQGASQRFILPEPVSRDLKHLCQSRGVTLFMAMLAAFEVLLYRYTGQADILVGTPIAGRNKIESEDLIGCFINTLVLRADFSQDLSFEDLLSHVREVVLDAYAHQDLPFEQLVDELDIKRGLSHTPLFQVMFVLQNAEQPPEGGFSDLNLSFMTAKNSVAKFDLTLVVQEKAGNIYGMVEYSNDLFDQATIERMTGHFGSLIEAIVTNPRQRVSELPLLSREEQHQVVVDWNQTRADYALPSSIHEMFERQAVCAPGAIALVYEDEQVSYAELNKRANQLAHYLRRLEVGPEDMVGLCVDRSIEMIVGLLGILKAGGAYVPLDQDYPTDRLRYILENTQARVVVTRASLAEFFADSGVKTVFLDTDQDAILRESELNPVSGVLPENPAYVIYTSGSTGKPKGVVIEHRQIINYTGALLDRIKIAPGSSFAMLQPLTVDSSKTVVFPSICSGGTLHVISKEQAFNPYALGDYFRKHSIDLLKIAPSHLAALQLSSSAEDLLPRRWLIIGGESPRLEWIEKLQSVAMSCAVHNHYGPTETTVGVLTHRVEKNGARKRLLRLPVGRPLANIQAYILDRHLKPAPVGVPGDLYIGGASLARGYLNRADATAENFIPDLFSNQPGRRFYRTGDVARYLPDGNIDFIGRRDHQIKIRGFRIELGEIEAALGQYPGMRQVLASAAEDKTGHKHLVAYVVSDQQPLPASSDLRKFLQTKLPAQMIPSAFVMMDSLPRTAQGKLDRLSLPAPDLNKLDAGSNFMPPRNRVEERLAEIWAQAIGLKQVGIHDNFFELGGDSIISIQVIARANQAGIHLSTKQIFQHQTIAELAAASNPLNAINAEQGMITGPAPLTPIQHRFFEQNLPDPHRYSQAILLEARQEITPVLLKQVVEHLLAHHDGLRLRYKLAGSNWQQVSIAPGEAVPFAPIDLSTLDEEEQEAAIENVAKQLQASLDFIRGPLVRVAFFKLGAKRMSRVLVVIHHLAVDAISWRILLDDLQTACQQLSNGLAIKLPPKTTSFKYWAERLSGYARSHALVREMEYWTSKGRRDTSSLFVDYPEGLNTLESARRVSVSLSKRETQALLQETLKAYHTEINNLLLTALSQSLKDWSGERRLLVDLRGHGREQLFEDIDLSRTVGWFTSVFPVLLEIEETFDAAQALEAVGEQLRKLPNRGIGYGLLRYMNEESRAQLRELPQALIAFNYLGQLDQVFAESAILVPVKEMSGLARDGRAIRPYLLEINANVINAELHLAWTYSQHLHRRETIESLARGFIETLGKLIVNSQSREARGYTF